MDLCKTSGENLELQEEEMFLRKKMDRIEQLMHDLCAIDPMEGDLDQIEAILDELDQLDPPSDWTEAD